MHGEEEVLAIGRPSHVMADKESVLGRPSSNSHGPKGSARLWILFAIDEILPTTIVDRQTLWLMAPRAILGCLPSPIEEESNMYMYSFEPSISAPPAEKFSIKYRGTVSKIFEPQRVNGGKPPGRVLPRCPPSTPLDT
ncbi:hypothetical protein VTN96DRAFT_7167 [Rasamsonia emersonii]|uniref:Uncharacterized protein n=1 Tax=Rasamsonia emersonii (strain ATCC 16479 / CBS 393.64 / IMI 116815) TaxID=1408163 RepID=A0A0F4YEX1_RASE3|nr:hypothetical protein T310_9694 [Rasamsonia emersonii CBS 393.64]KKA16685.1 hypothetical protein T310_9694 [Rasamsonia emersonii CBS 393.64]